MLTHFFEEPRALQRLYAGPLGPHMDGFSELLITLQHGREYTRGKLRLIAKLSHWLHQRNRGVDDLDERTAEEFYRWSRRAYYLGERSTLRLFLEHLRNRNILPPAVPEPDDTAISQVERDYVQYLLQERGLSQETVNRYASLIRQFILERFGKKPPRFEKVTLPDISRHILRHSKIFSAGQCKLIVTALRSFFRFLCFHGEIEKDLAAAVPCVPHWRLSTVPKYLKPQEVEILLEKCDRSKAIGQRDYAILMLLARLGLRAGEVVRMQLEDLNWEAGELLVHGKRGLQDKLPIPPDVGEALVAYLRHGRPRCSTRHVFVRTVAPYREFAVPMTITSIVNRALRHAGLEPPRKGAYILRHSLATRALREGASLTEVGELLRHRTPSTTEIYAKVDFVALRTLAQSWPGGRP